MNSSTSESEPGGAARSGGPGDPAAFVAQWLDAWNAHDVEAVLEHFHDHCRFSSPVARRVVGGDGVVRGKAALREYWNRALTMVPDLAFELVGVYVGVSMLVINYRNQRGGLVDEVLIFDGDRVLEGHGTYLDAGENPAGLGPAQ